MTDIPPTDKNERKSLIVTGLVGPEPWLYLNNARFHQIIDTLAIVVMEMADKTVVSCKEDVAIMKEMRKLDEPTWNKRHL
jgi:hypothetical protein